MNHPSSICMLNLIECVFYFTLTITHLTVKPFKTKLLKTRKKNSILDRYNIYDIPSVMNIIEILTISNFLYVT